MEVIETALDDYYLPEKKRDEEESYADMEVLEVQAENRAKNCHFWEVCNKLRRKRYFCLT